MFNSEDAMNELITLICPSCGGKLTVQKGASTYVCDYCGQTHRLRNEDVEAFSRCPVCHRNDKVEKLTSIYKRQDNLARAFPLPEAPPFVIAELTDQQNPGVVKPFAIEPELKFVSIKKKQVRAAFDMELIFGIAFIVTLISNPDKFLLPVLFLLLTLATLVFGIINDIKGQTDEKRVQAAIDEQVPLVLSSTTERYNTIYYCQRDDVIFIPGEEGPVPASEYVHFLYKPLVEEAVKVGFYPRQNKIVKRSS